MNEKLGIGIVIVAIVAVAIFSGCVEEKASTPVVTPSPTPSPTLSPTPPLETVSDNVKEIKIKIEVFYRDMNIAFKDEWGRSFSKLDDGNTQVKMETFSGDMKLIDEEIKGIGAGEGFSNIDLPNVTPRTTFGDYCEHLNVTITLPNGKTARTSIDFDYIAKHNALLYDYGYDEGKKDARIGYSPEMHGSGYYGKGYLDGYIGATPRYRYHPTTETITIE